MSIIHEALKKAASEGASGVSKSTLGGNALTVSAQIPGRYRWITVSLIFLILPGLFFAARHLLFLFSNHLDRPDVHAVLPLSNQDRHPGLVSDGKPTRDHQSNNLSNEKGLQHSQAIEGEQALTAGIKLYHEGRIEEASLAFRRTVELLPSSPAAHNNLGMVLRHQRKTSEALAHYREAIRLDPNYAEAENNMGLIYDQAGSIDEAAIHYKRAINIKPMLPAFHLNYATLLERKGDFQSARKEYLIYLSLENDHQSEIIPIVQSHLNKLKGF